MKNFDFLEEKDRAFVEHVFTEYPFKKILKNISSELSEEDYKKITEILLKAKTLEDSGDECKSYESLRVVILFADGDLGDKPWTKPDFFDFLNNYPHRYIIYRAKNVAENITNPIRILAKKLKESGLKNELIADSIAARVIDPIEFLSHYYDILATNIGYVEKRKRVL